jgi:hypothetical protein
MPDTVSVKALTIPVSMLTTILGGSAWLTTTRADLDHLTEKVEINRLDEQAEQHRIYDKIESLDEMERLQDVRLSRMEGKQDVILQTIQQLEKRLSNEQNRNQRN